MAGLRQKSNVSQGKKKKKRINFESEMSWQSWETFFFFLIFKQLNFNSASFSFLVFFFSFPWTRNAYELFANLTSWHITVKSVLWYVSYFVFVLIFMRFVLGLGAMIENHTTSPKKKNSRKCILFRTQTTNNSSRDVIVIMSQWQLI